MNLNYYILVKDKQGLYNIELRGFEYGNQFRWNTKIKVSEKEWDKKRQKHKKNDDVNRRLNELKSYASNYFLCDSPSPKGFLDYMDEQTGRKVKSQPKSFFNVMDEIVSNSVKRTNSNGEQISESRIRLYHTFVDQLKSFEKSSKNKITFEDLSLKTMEELSAWLVNNRKLAPNTLYSRFRLFRTMLMEAEKMGYEVNQDYRKFKVKTTKVENVVLTEDEVQLMTNYICNSERLQNTQDLFTIGVYTGLRFSDIRQLTEANIHGDKLELHQQKTGGKVVIPLHPKVKSMLEERGLPHPITGQKYNIYLRELASLAGVNDIVEIKKTKAGKRIILKKEKSELISSHTCRRTFATLLYKKGINPKLIMLLTGHKQLATFLNYVIVDNDDAIKAVQQTWSSGVIS